MATFFTDCKACALRNDPDPNICYGCARPVVVRIPPGACRKCAQTMRNDQCTNSDCAAGLNVFGRTYAFGIKQSLLHEAIVTFKDHHNSASHLAKPLGKILAGFIRRNDCFRSYHFFLPMPKHPESVREKGFDQIAEIYRVAAPHLSDVFQVDTLDIAPYLIQCKKVPTLRHLGAKERREAVRDAFCLSFDTDIFEGKRVLIFDDVITTGSTMSAAAAPLLRAGAEVVDAVVLGRSPW